MLTEAGYRQRTDNRELVLIDTENDTEFFFLRPATSRSTSAPGAWTSASPARTCCSIPEPTPRRSCRSASPVDVPLRRPGRQRADGREARRKRIATAYPGVVEAYLVGTASRPR